MDSGPPLRKCGKDLSGDIMGIRRTSGFAVTFAAMLACAAPALAQEPEGAPDPELAEEVVLDEESLVLYECMGVSYDGEEEDAVEDAKETPEELAAREAACTELIETGSGWAKETGLSYRANIRWRSGRKKEAVADYSALIRLSPRSAHYRQSRASLYSDLKQYDKANEDLMVALKQAPMDAGMHNSMCWMLAMEGRDLPRAIQYCNIAIGLSPAYASARDSRAMVYFKMGQFEKALADYERAMNIEPAGAHYMYGRGLALLRLGQKDEGSKWLDRAIAADAGIAGQYASYGVKP